MPTVHIDTDEAYPVYYLHPTIGAVVTLTDSELALVRRAEAIDGASQAFLEAKSKGAASVDLADELRRLVGGAPRRSA